MPRRFLLPPEEADSAGARHQREDSGDDGRVAHYRRASLIAALAAMSRRSASL